MATPPDPAKQLTALAGELQSISKNLATLQSQLAQTGATAGTVAASTNKLAVQASSIADTLPIPDVPLPVGPKPIPYSPQLPILNARSGTGWPFGMGQNAGQADEWVQRYGPLGAVALWTNIAQTWTWDEIRGGAKGNPEKLGNAFTNGNYAANLKGFTTHLNQFPDVPIVIMHPLIPSVAGISNMGKQGNWKNPEIWKDVTSKDLDLWKSVWFDYGSHLAYWALLNKRNCVGACIGWELTGRWYDWSIGPQWRPFPDAWRWLADRFYAGIEKVDAALVSKIHLEMRVAGGVSQRLDGYALRDIFPGKDYMRVLGVSMHETGSDDWSTPAGFQAELKTGVNEVVELCRETGLPLGLDEVNIRSADSSGYEKKSKNPAVALQQFFAWAKSLPVPIAWCCWLQSSTANALDAKWAGAQEISRQLNTLRAHYAAQKVATAAVEQKQEVASQDILEGESGSTVA